MNRKLAISVVIIIICAVVAAGGYLAVKPLIEQRQVTSGDAGEQVHQEDVATISYDGKQYKYNQGLETVLFIGLDASMEADYLDGDGSGRDSESDNESVLDASNEPEQDGEVEGTDSDAAAEQDEGSRARSYNNQAQSDFVTLILLDHRAKEVNILQLNRDTICDIPVLDTKGEVAGSKQAQLALAHTFGSGGRDSCVNVRKTVSGLLYGTKIDHFFRISTESIGTLNDLVGGVTLTLEDDFTAYDKSMREGKTITLKGKQAEVFVRARKQMAEPTNVARMKRQKAYMEKWLEQARIAAGTETAGSTAGAEAGEAEEIAADEADSTAGAETSSTDIQVLLNEGLEKISGDLESDMSIYQLASVIECAQEYELGKIVSPKGRAEKAGEHMAFYVDEEALMKTVVELFYVEM